MEKSVEAKTLLKEERKKKREENRKIQKDYLVELRNNSANKRSLWLNFIAFFIPIWGLFAAFAYLVKCPKRAKSLFITCMVSFIFQFGFLAFCYMFLFDYIGEWCITIFG